jgi:putative two-component system response regulator
VAAPAAPRYASILIVDDQASNVRLLEQILRREDYVDLRSTTDSGEVIELCRQRMPDLILLDLHMPGVDGVELMQRLRAISGVDFPQILVLTGDASTEAKARALSSGARDFLAKPFEISEVILRIHNLIDLRLLHLQLRDQNEELEQRVLERTHELDEARCEVIEKLGMAAEFRDDATGQHTVRVGRSASLLAGAFGLPPSEVELIARAAPLHDVGKIAIPDRILLKPGLLTEAEMVVMRTHTEIGARLLAKSKSPMLVAAQQIALTHHERWDGAGYPNGLSGDAIPLFGRIVALADFFDAMCHDRPYRRRFPAQNVKIIMAEQRGQHFDPILTDIFLREIADRPEIRDPEVVDLQQTGS